MDPVPYEIREEDVDEVLGAYASAGELSEEDRAAAHDYVMRHLTDLNEIVRSAPEERRLHAREDPGEPRPVGMRPGDESPARRELALAAIEDLLIRDGLIAAADEESRVFPVVPDDEPRRNA